MGDNRIWSLPSVSSLSNYSIRRSQSFCGLAVIAFRAFEFIDREYYDSLGKAEIKQSRPPNLRRLRSTRVIEKPDTFKLSGRVMRSVLFVRPKCSHRSVSPKKSPMKAVITDANLKMVLTYCDFSCSHAPPSPRIMILRNLNFIGSPQKSRGKLRREGAPPKFEASGTKSHLLPMLC